MPKQAKKYSSKIQGGARGDSPRERDIDLSFLKKSNLKI